MVLINFSSYGFFQAMIDVIGGARKVNNIYATLNIRPNSEKNLKKMECHANETIEEFADENMRTEAKIAFAKEAE